MAKIFAGRNFRKTYKMSNNRKICFTKFDDASILKKDFIKPSINKKNE